MRVHNVVRSFFARAIYRVVLCVGAVWILAANRRFLALLPLTQQCTSTVYSLLPPLSTDASFSKRIVAGTEVEVIGGAES